MLKVRVMQHALRGYHVTQLIYMNHADSHADLYEP